MHSIAQVDADWQQHRVDFHSVRSGCRLHGPDRCSTFENDPANAARLFFFSSLEGLEIRAAVGPALSLAIGDSTPLRDPGYLPLFLGCTRSHKKTPW